MSKQPRKNSNSFLAKWRNGRGINEKIAALAAHLTDLAVESALELGQ